MLSRRGLITGLLGLVAAPAIVKAESLMPVRSEAPYRFWTWRAPLLPPIPWENSPPLDWSKWLGPNGRPFVGTWTFYGNQRNIYSDECVAFSKAEFEPLDRWSKQEALNAISTNPALIRFR